jgi:beta-lactamase class C
MKKFKFLNILFILILIVIAFKFSLMIGKSGLGKTIIDVTEVNHAKEIQEVLTKFDSLYNINIEQSGAIGGAVVITYKGQVAMIKCFGVKKAGDNSLVDENTVFRLASVSKAVTGVLAGILADDKTIDLEEKVIDYLPEFRLKFPESTNSITIRHLLSHTTGLIPHAFDMMVEDKVPLNKILPRLNEVDIVTLPGLFYAYQNVMFSLYDPITAIKTKKSFQTILERKDF